MAKEYKFPSKVIIKTNKPVAFDSPDHIEPWGTKRDNSINLNFNKRLFWWFPPEKRRVLDIGCSGGGFVKSVIDQGGFAVGIEGSDFSKKNKRAEWATIPNNLFTADATAPFELFEVDGNEREIPILFDIITAWEFIEHIQEKQLPDVFANMRRHLAPNGVIIMSISPNEEYINGVRLHQTVQGKEWWHERLDELGFTNHKHVLAYFGSDLVREESNAQNSFHVVLTRKGESLPFADRVSRLQFDYVHEGPGHHLVANFVESGYFRDKPLHIIYAGVHGGFEAHWDEFREQIHLIGFEPEVQECEQLNASQSTKFNRKEEYYPVGLYSTKTVKTLHVTKNGVASSFLEPNIKFVKRFPQSVPGAVVGQCQVPTIDLDSFIEENGIQYVDFIKLDVEGCELDVLKGATNALHRSILGISIETSLQTYRIGQPTFAEIDALLKEKGFVLFDLVPERWRRNSFASQDDLSTWYNGGQIMRAQALYFRDLVAEFKDGRLKGSPEMLLPVIKQACLAELFGFADYSIELLDTASELGCF